MIDVDDEDIEKALAAHPMKQVAKVLDITGDALLGRYAVAHIVVAFFTKERLRLDLIFDGVKIVRMNHSCKRTRYIIHEFFEGFAAEEMNDIDVGKDDLFIAFRLIDKESSG